MLLLMPSIYVVVGCLILAWSADRFILGASAIARNFGVSPLVIGMALVGFATSFPEMIVSALAAFNGNPVIGIGNAIGSNIANVGLVLGVSAIIVPLRVHSKILRREFPLLVVILILALILMWDDYLSRIDGIILFAGFILMLFWLYIQAKRASKSDDPLVQEFEEEIPTGISTPMAVFWLLLGLVLLFGSSRLLVSGAVDIARHFGVSDLVIGLTIVALGTSLPELAASIMGVLKGEHDIAVGNVVGSNMFNLLAVLAMPGLIAPSAIPPHVLTRDYPVMMIFTFVLMLISYGLRGKGGRINRIEGGILVLGYIGFLVLLAPGS